MKYFIVGYEHNGIAVCKTRAAAEELILSYAQEYQYEDYLLFGSVCNLNVCARGLWIEEVGEY